LQKAGVGHHDRVAVFLPNVGPEMAVAVIAVAAGAVCVPVNPQLADGNWYHYLRELHVQALIVVSNSHDYYKAAIPAAEKLNIQIIELCPLPDAGAGSFVLKGQRSSHSSELKLPKLHDDAIILTTSGSTSQPKAVPLTHLNLCHSASNTGMALKLTGDDRLLSVLPLHHAHGLISGLISSLAAGSSVICMKRFNVTDFYELLRRYQPTWYTAVPAIHRAIADEAPEQQETVRHHSLRFIRSASATLPRRWLVELENIFHVPVIDTYGMTEAASQIASNPLPPQKRKTGSVGLAAGPEITIMDSDGREVFPGTEGEIALRGPNVTRGYDGDETVNKFAFKNGWFRTGDLGYIDEEGYLFITGRLKEIINRAGENIAPLKIENVLLEHPDVTETAVFPVAHPRLGEDVAAVTVLHPKSRATPRSLRDFVIESGKLTQSEVPRHIKIVEIIPKTETGKIARNQLARKFGIHDLANSGQNGQAGYRAPANEIERQLCKIWEEVLGLDRVGTQDDFFVLGGDSLMAVEVAVRVFDVYEETLLLDTIFDAPTVAELAKKISEGLTKFDADQELEVAKPERQKIAALSVAQEVILRIDRNFLGLPIYNMPFSFRLLGDLNLDAFERSVELIVSRHQSLRTNFNCLNGQFSSIVKPYDACQISVQYEDWTIIPDRQKINFAKVMSDEEAWISFNLAETPPFRVRLLKLAKDDHILFLTIHHVISDGWSIRIFLSELSQFYASFRTGNSPDLCNKNSQFAEFARWQRQWSKGKEAKKQLDYWKEKLREPKSLFTNNEGLMATKPGFCTGRTPVRLPKNLIESLTELVLTEKCTVFMALLTGFKACLSSKFCKNDLCIATPMANRLRKNTQNIIGLIENPAIVRTIITDELSFRSALRCVREAVLEAYTRQELPFATLTEELESAQKFSTAPLYEVYFSFTNRYGSELQLSDLGVSPFLDIDKHGQPVLPLNGAKIMLMLNETPSGTTGSCIYKEDQFDNETVERFLSGYRNFLSRAASEPDQTLSRLFEQIKF